jgi:uncharacterized protein (TIGR00299 family) protein
MRIVMDFPGGISGDMFIAAILNTWPEFRELAEQTVIDVGLPEVRGLNVTEGRNGGLKGTKIDYDISANEVPRRGYSDIVALLRDSRVESEAVDIAVDLLDILADAECSVHGVSRQELHLHEVSSTDSILDFMVCAALIRELRGMDWDIGDMPKGNGTVTCEHGVLPVPVPAVAEMLQGFSFYIDDEIGERVTPTGAAIVKYLSEIGCPSKRPHGLILRRVGIGLGRRNFECTPNVLRIGVYETGTQRNLGNEPAIPDWQVESIAVVEFDVDDQTPEDLAIAVEHLRQEPGVADVCQTIAVGKKGRVYTSVRILVRHECLTQFCARCFEETTTLGIRVTDARRFVLKRTEVRDDNTGSSVKVARRPNGTSTAKADIDAVSGLRKHEHRVLERRRMSRSLASDNEDETIE